jgi:Flp pilus assembly protein TadG
MAFASLAVDYGRVQAARSELQTMADAAARHAIARLAATDNPDVAIAAAQTVAGENRVDGAFRTLATHQIEFVSWNSSSRTFSVLTGNNRRNANAVRISTSVTVPMTWARFIGWNNTTVTADTIVAETVSGGGATQTRTVDVEAEMSVWYAGNPAGSNTAFGPYGDRYSRNKPAQVNLPGGLTSGAILTFQTDNGVTWPGEWTGDDDDDDAPAWAWNADGSVGWSWNGYIQSRNGISGIDAPFHGVVGVFLDDNSPENSATPTKLDFTTPASRDYTTLAPQMKQVFWIGNGKTSGGQDHQIVVPAGAKRLFLGIVDEHGLFTHNAGEIEVTVTQRQGGSGIARVR